MLRRTLLKSLAAMPLFSLPRLPESKLDKKARKIFLAWYNDPTNNGFTGQICQSIIPIYSITTDFVQNFVKNNYNKHTHLGTSYGTTSFEQSVEDTLDSLKMGYLSKYNHIGLYIDPYTKYAGYICTAFNPPSDLKIHGYFDLESYYNGKHVAGCLFIPTKSMVESGRLKEFAKEQSWTY